MPIEVKSVAARILVSAIARNRLKEKMKIATATLRFACEAANVSVGRFAGAIAELEESGYITIDNNAIVVQKKFIDDMNS